MLVKAYPCCELDGGHWQRVFGRQGITRPSVWPSPACPAVSQPIPLCRLQGVGCSTVVSLSSLIISLLSLQSGGCLPLCPFLMSQITNIINNLGSFLWNASLSKISTLFPGIPLFPEHRRSYLYPRQTPALCQHSQCRRQASWEKATELILPENLGHLQLLSWSRVCHRFLPLVRLL